MKFLSAIWLPAWALFVLIGSYHGKHDDPLGLAGLAAISLFWLWINIPITIVYVVVRIFRRASRDAAQP